MDNDTTEVYDEVREQPYHHILTPVGRGPTASLHSGDRKWESGMTGPPGSVDGSSSQSLRLTLSQIKKEETGAHYTDSLQSCAVKLEMKRPNTQSLTC